MRPRIKSTADFAFSNEIDVPADSFAAQPLNARLSLIHSRMKAIKLKRLRLEKKEPKNKQWLSAIVEMSPKEKEEQEKEGVPKEDSLLGKERKKKSGLIEITKKMNKIQNKEVQRVTRLYSQKAIDKNVINDLKTYLRLVTNDVRAEEEITKFIKEHKVEHKAH